MLQRRQPLLPQAGPPENPPCIASLSPSDVFVRPVFQTILAHQSPPKGHFQIRNDGIPLSGATMMNDRQAGFWSLSSGGGQTLHSQPEGLQPVLRILPRKPGAHHRPGGYFSEDRRWPPVRVSRASANRTRGDFATHDLLERRLKAGSFATNLVSPLHRSIFPSGHPVSPGAWSIPNPAPAAPSAVFLLLTSPTTGETGGMGSCRPKPCRRRQDTPSVADLLLRDRIRDVFLCHLKRRVRTRHSI